MIKVVSEQDPEADATLALIERLRAEGGRASGVAALGAVDVGGYSGQQHDITELVSSNLWKIFLFVMVCSYLVLLLVLRSVILPLKAVLMNLLTVAAAYGVLVMFFQYGWFDWTGFDHLGYVNLVTPPLLLAIVFGLSMDYEVFLLSRIRERYLATGDNRRSVAEGLQQSAKVISSAAIIMVVVFSIFATTGVPQVKEIGVGLAVAIALDATLVRLVLVPATMELMGSLELVAARVAGPDPPERRLRDRHRRGGPRARRGRLRKGHRMASQLKDIARSAPDAARGLRPVTTWREDMITMALTLWGITAMFFDGRGHNNETGQESFFSTAHLFLYTGMTVLGLWIGLVVLRYQGVHIRKSLIPDLKLIPVGYGVAIIGLITLGIGGPADLIWHEAYGFEVGVEAIYSAPHLMLFFGGLLVSSTGIRSMWAKQDLQLDFKQSAPVLLSTVLFIGVAGFITMYLSAFMTNVAMTSDFMNDLDRFKDDFDNQSTSLNAGLTGYGDDSWPYYYYSAGHGVATIIITTLVLVGPILLLLRRWRLPFGGVTTIFLGYGLLVNIMTEYRDAVLILPLVLAGLTFDLAQRRFGSERADGRMTLGGIRVRRPGRDGRPVGLVLHRRRAHRRDGLAAVDVGRRAARRHHVRLRRGLPRRSAVLRPAAGGGRGGVGPQNSATKELHETDRRRPAQDRHDDAVDRTEHARRADLPHEGHDGRHAQRGRCLAPRVQRRAAVGRGLRRVPGHGRLARGLPLARADGALPRRQGAAQRPRRELLGAVDERHDRARSTSATRSCAACARRATGSTRCGRPGWISTSTPSGRGRGARWPTRSATTSSARSRSMSWTPRSTATRRSSG